MVAMLSFFCEAAEPLFNNCFSSTNNGYDYLMFSNENRRKNASIYRKVNVANKCSVINISQINSFLLLLILLLLLDVFLKKYLEHFLLHKASSAPPLETFSVKEENINNFLYSRQNSFNKLNIRRKSSTNSKSRTKINCRGTGSVERKTSGFGPLL
ncbi:hypothetical protein Mgra_00007409 [Meloidogyne graminicola]|uniref:Uncharacterized protein n=1 Tax=Meloidogyne graminicola TaxID=189291 RepID=A0A8S9ZIR7_9BILA|nr:hypothetical protein Mgra_00007409 [Meloidogyne graminicola]